MNRIISFMILAGVFLLVKGCTPAAHVQDKPMYMWFDIEANFKRLSYPDSISFYLDKIQDLGFTDVVLDVKSIMGEVAYQSKYAPYMKEWYGHVRPDDYDLVGIFIRESHKRGLTVHASLNVFSGGHNYYDRGIIYDKQYAHWQSQNYWNGQLMPISEMKWNYNGMLNPALPEVQKYQLDIIRELLQQYPDLDGVILDRGRFDSITSDFSEASKKMFEKYAKLTVNNFPDDVIFWENNDQNEYVWRRGKHFNKWIEWRAMVIHDFFEEARSLVKQVNPDVLFGAYTGGWYPVYYELGVNWASNKYDPSLEYDWATPEYKNSGYAEMLEVYLSGLYFFEVTIEEVERMNEEAMLTRGEAAMGKGRDYWYSVEGCAQLVNELTKGVVPVTGTLYVDQYEMNSKQFERAVAMAYSSSDGLGIFDIVHIIQKDWWDVLARGIEMGKNAAQ